MQVTGTFYALWQLLDIIAWELGDIHGHLECYVMTLSILALRSLGIV